MKDRLTGRRSTASLGGHMRHNVVAYLALFVALGGTSAWAASGGITGTQVKDESLTGADVLNNSLTGVDVNESSLTVPFAAKAGDAGTLDTQTLGQVRSGINADKLDGLDVTTVTDTWTVPDGTIITDGTAGPKLTCPNDRLAVQLASTGAPEILEKRYDHSSVRFYVRHDDSLGSADQTAQVSLTCVGE